MRNNTGLSVAAIVTLALTPVHAQGRGGSHVPQNTTHATSTPSQQPTNPSGRGPSTHRPTTTTSTSTSTSSGSKSSTTTSNTTTTGSTATTTTLNPVAAKIQSHPQLASRVNTMLKGTGLTLDQASSGFRNQGQFIAALHVSQNLGIKFTDLKNTMLGTTTTGATTGTGTSGTTSTGSTLMSLGQAIHKLRPSVDSQSATTQATTQANTDLNGK